MFRAMEVIQFDLEYTPCAIDPAELFGADVHLKNARDLCVNLGVIGQTPLRYGGLGFGNVSCRATYRGQSGFLVSGSQTAGIKDFDLKDCAFVYDFDVRKNRVVSFGPTKPSSETLCHVAAYSACPEVGAVIHGHAIQVWHAMGGFLATDHAPEFYATDSSATCGTVALALEVERQFLAHGSPLTLALAGHEDGILLGGANLEEVCARMKALVEGKILPLDKA